VGTASVESVESGAFVDAASRRHYYDRGDREKEDDGVEETRLIVLESSSAPRRDACALFELNL